MPISRAQGGGFQFYWSSLQAATYLSLHKSLDNEQVFLLFEI